MKVKLHCFGKHPCYQDFVIFDCASSLATDFRKWLEAAFSDYRKDDFFLTEQDFAFLVAHEEQKEALVGLIRDSSDQGGLRPFPFAAFLALPGKVVKKAAASISALSLEPMWHEIQRLDSSIQRMDSLSAIHDCFKGWNPEPVQADKNGFPLKKNPLFGNDLQSVTAPLGGFEGDTPWNRLIWGIKLLGEVDDDWLFRGGIRWPLIPSLDPQFQIDLWNHLLARERCMNGKTSLPKLFTIIYPRSPNTFQSGTVLFRNLIPEDVLLFQHDSDPPPGVLDLSGHSRPLTLEGYYGFQQALKDVLPTAGLKIGDLFRLKMTSGDRFCLSPEIELMY